MAHKKLDRAGSTFEQLLLKKCSAVQKLACLHDDQHLFFNMYETKTQSEIAALSI